MIVTHFVSRAVAEATESAESPEVGRVVGCCVWRDTRGSHVPLIVLNPLK